MKPKDLHGTTYGSGGSDIKVGYLGRLRNDLLIFKSTGKGTFSADDVERTIEELRTAKALLLDVLAGDVGARERAREFLDRHDEVKGYELR